MNPIAWLRPLVPARWKILYRRARARLVDPFDTGVWVNVSGARVRVPAYFYGNGWENYEVITTARFLTWLKAHPTGQLIDVGCSVSTYGSVALSQSIASSVIGIDPDLVSLKCTRLFCSKVDDPTRLRLVHGFVGPEDRAGMNLDDAVAATTTALDDPGVPSVKEASAFRESTDPRYATVPRYSLETLLAHEPAGRPCLLKIDVEGWELAVLQGAAGFLARCQPAILLSSHPFSHEKLGTTTQALYDFIEAAGYRMKHIATDHEEHWWCEPA